jgi:hypothetical protein
LLLIPRIGHSRVTIRTWIPFGATTPFDRLLKLLHLSRSTDGAHFGLARTDKR